MNIGDFIYDLSKTLIEFAKNSASLFTATLDISKLLNIINALGIDTSSLPSNLSVLSLIGGFSGFMFLTFLILKLIK